ncbi:MAG: CRISPR-associated helicase Cas3' [Candidatus Micrarchaeota archaeon]
MEVFYSHPKESERPLLAEHSIRVSQLSEKLLSFSKKLQAVGRQAGLLHDIGKLNPYYQELFSTDEKSRPEVQTRLMRRYLRGHSWFSAIAAYGLLPNPENIRVSTIVAAHHSQLLQPSKASRHHTRNRDKTTLNASKAGLLKNADRFRLEVSSRPEFAGLDWEGMRADFDGKALAEKNLKDYPGMDWLDYSLIYSALLQADRGSFQGSDEWLLRRYSLELDTGRLASDKSASALAKLRTDFQKEILENGPFSGKIIVLEAPTGIGKTKAFLDLMNRMKAEGLERVFYFSPLLALTDDFEDKLTSKVIGVGDGESKCQVLIYNHVFAGTLEEREKSAEGPILDEEEDHEQEFFKKWDYFAESFNYPLVITTTQRLLMTLYSNHQRDRMKFLSFKNSLLIVDEVQTLPKWLLPNFIKLMQELSERMGTRILLVSATVPNELGVLPRLKFAQETKKAYLEKTRKKVVYLGSVSQEDLIKQIPPAGRVMVMFNKRKKARKAYEEIRKMTGKRPVYYLSSGVAKKQRKETILGHKVPTGNREGGLSDSKNKDAIVVCTQVMEAGVDASFDRIFREMAPLDNIIQAMGRLNREALAGAWESEITIFRLDMDFEPYPELEWIESEKVLCTLTEPSSVELYSRLEAYYDKVHGENEKNKDMVGHLEDYLDKVEFDEVWKYVRDKALPKDERESVYVPSLKEWNACQDDLSRGGKRYKKWLECTATLPCSVYKIPAYQNLFVSELMENGILLPKKDKLDAVYDNILGLDKLIQL